MKIGEVKEDCVWWPWTTERAVRCHRSIQWLESKFVKIDVFKPKQITNKNTERTSRRTKVFAKLWFRKMLRMHRSHTMFGHDKVQPGHIEWWLFRMSQWLIVYYSSVLRFLCSSIVAVAPEWFRWRFDWDNHLQTCIRLAYPYMCAGSIDVIAQVRPIDTETAQCGRKWMCAVHYGLLHQNSTDGIRNSICLAECHMLTSSLTISFQFIMMHRTVRGNWERNLWDSGHIQTDTPRRRRFRCQSSALPWIHSYIYVYYIYSQAPAILCDCIYFFVRSERGERRPKFSTCIVYAETIYDQPFAGHRNHFIGRRL